MKKIAVIGHFGIGKNLLNGQTIKTKVLTEALQESLGKENVQCVDTHGGLKTLIKLVFKIPAVIKENDDIIMLPAHNGVLIFTPLLSFFNAFTKKKLHYVVIGGWLPEYLDNHKVTARLLRKKFVGIYVETSVMKRALLQREFENIHILPNYKNMDSVSKTELSIISDYPIKTCTFSRVTEKKGISDAVQAVTDINTKADKVLLTLDIYGSVDETFKEEFESILRNSPEYICYKGEVDFNQTIQTLKNYDLQLFPTKFKTEGIPGSVVESFFAGVPVVASRWNSFEDVIDEGVTGIGFEFGNYEDFEAKLNELLSSLEKLNIMKRNCLKKAEEYRLECKRKLEEYFLT